MRCFRSSAIFVSTHVDQLPSFSLSFGLGRSHSCYARETGFFSPQTPIGRHKTNGDTHGSGWVLYLLTGWFFSTPHSHNVNEALV